MIYTFTGKNSFTLQTELNKLVATAIEESGEFAVERFDASDSEADILLQAVQSVPFLVPKKTVIIRNIQSNTVLIEKLEDVVNRTAENVDVILVEPALDKRKSSYKLLQKLTSMREFAEPKSFELPRWIVEQAKTHGATISKTDADYLVERVGANQQLLSNEVEKLSLYNNKIDKESITALTEESLQHGVFTLLDAAFSGDNKRAVELYREQRRARIEPHYILAMLVWQLMSVAQAVYAEDKTESALIEARQSPFSARKSLSLAKRLNKADVKKMIIDLSELDGQIKTDTDADAGLELYLLNL